MSSLFHGWLLLFVTGCLMLGACSESTPSGPEDPFFEEPADPSVEEPADPPPPVDDGSDLSIRYIQRLPPIDYVWNSNNPAVEGWPAVDQDVTWRAHVVNWAGHNRDSVTYAWFLDGEEVAVGAVDIPAGGEATVDLPWSWTFDRHVLAFVLDSADAFAEDEEHNNRQALFTDALTVGFYVEESLYDYFRAHQHKLGVGATTFDDWAHRQIDRWNTMLADAIYPVSPDAHQAALSLFP